MNNDPQHNGIYEQMSKMEQTIQFAKDELDPCISSEGLDITRLIKTLDMRVDHENGICEDLIQECSMIKRFTKIRLIAIAGVSCYIHHDDFKQLIRELAYLNTPILMIDHERDPDYPCKLFDDDFCELNFKTDKEYLFEV